MKHLLLILAVAFAGATCVAAEESVSPRDIAHRAIESRAVEAVIWGMPAVNYDLMLQEMLTKTPGKVNQMIYWGKPLDWHNQTLTPNPDTLYFMTFFNTSNGPIVLEIPPGDAAGSLTGNIVTAWQSALEDVGLLGLDKGAGAKYLVLPPKYKDAIPNGYTVLPSDTYGGYALLRVNLKSHNDSDVADAVAYGKRIKIYPLSTAANPPETVFNDVEDVNYDSTIQYDVNFFEHLNRVVQSEPWIERDRAMIDQLRSIGIEKGSPFAPDEATKKILTAAAGEAKGLLEKRYDAAPPPFYPGSHWTYPTLQEAIEGQATTYADHDKYAIDARGLLYTYGYIAIKRPGTAQFYLISIRDKDGQGLDGKNIYRLRVPTNAPVQQYWSLTAYDRETHALIKNVDRASRASNAAEVKKNADGSVDLYVGPKAPEGRETNWIPADPARKFELMFRLYGPKKEFFEKTWALPDIERIGTESVEAKPDSAAVPVTADNFVRAESDVYIRNMVKDGSFGKFLHRREPATIDKQTVIRLNRDTLYSSAVFDLDAGPVTITLPEAGKRFMSMQIIDEDQYTHGVFYGAGSHTLDKDHIGTRYVVAGIRTLVDPPDSNDVEQVHALQDAIKVEQANSGTFEVPNWDQVSQKKVRDALLALGSTVPDSKGMFGTKDQVDPVRRLIGAATAWGGNPETEATYLNFTPAKNDGVIVHRLAVKDVPVDGFWSISVYNAKGYFEPNKLNAYALNNITAKKADDGSVAVQFGACDGKIANCLPIMPGWNYLVRLYRPRVEVLNGTWKFPQAQPVESGSATGASTGTGKE